MHESFRRYFSAFLYSEILAWLNEILPGFSAIPSGSPRIPLDPDFSKEPDEGLYIWRSEGHYGIYPNMIIEVGYSETWNDLEKDASEWLWGSEGEVRCVLLVNLMPPAGVSPDSDDFRDETKWEGYLEIRIRSSKPK
jgi:hypothetical protein